MERHPGSQPEDYPDEDEESERKRRIAREIGERFLLDTWRHASFMERPAKKKLAPGKLRSVLRAIIQRKGRE